MGVGDEADPARVELSRHGSPPEEASSAAPRAVVVDGRAACGRAEVGAGTAAVVGGSRALVVVEERGAVARGPDRCAHRTRHDPTPMPPIAAPGHYRAVSPSASPPP